MFDTRTSQREHVVGSTALTQGKHSSQSRGGCVRRNSTLAGRLAGRCISEYSSRV